MTQPESLENRWDILYRDYPQVYEAFMDVPYQPSVFDQVTEIIDLQGKVIVDVGAGTGRSSLALARTARQVIGIEYEPAMLRQARKMRIGDEATRISYLCGDALALPLADNAVDIVTGFTLALFPAERYRDFIREGLRVAKGKVVYVGIPPGWYGGNLDPIIEDPDKGKFDVEMDRLFIEDFQFNYQDVFSYQDYGTIKNIVSIYGFIFGKKVIEHIKREKITTILWKYRVYWRE
jgi:ubiquinone/menaquinone biosynthesis C-methylase UbiE